MKLTIGHLYPDLLNLYGDRGNIQCLMRRCQWRGIEAETIAFELGDKIDFSRLDIVLLGGGSDREQMLVCEKLKEIANGIVQSRFTAEDVTQEVFSYFYEIKERLDASSEEKLHALVVWKTTNKGRDYLRKSYVKREVMFDNDVAELQYRTTESAEAALLGLEKQKYLSMAFEGLRRKNLINYMIFMRVVMEGVSTEEVAREFGYTRNNVNNRVLRARKWLLAEILRLEKE